MWRRWGQLLALHDKARSLVTHQFHSSPLFQKALKDSFEAFVNDKPAHSKYTTCEVLAHYTDHVLTAKDKQQEAELDKELDRIVRRAHAIAGALGQPAP